MKSKLLLGVVVVLVMIAGIHLSFKQRSAVDDTAITRGTPFDAVIGQRFMIDGTSDHFLVKHLVSDSRCASDVDCIIAGNAALEVQINNDAPVTVYDNGIATMSGAYGVSLDPVQPPRGAMADEIKPEDYRLRFTVQ